MTETERKTFILPKALVARMKKYQRDTYSKSLTEASIQLIVKGLEASGTAEHPSGDRADNQR